MPLVGAQGRRAELSLHRCPKSLGCSGLTAAVRWLAG